MASIAQQASDPRKMRQFGLLMAACIGGFFGILFPLVFKARFHVWTVVIAALFCVAGLTRPLWLGPLFRVWMRFALVLGWVNSRILLSIVYYIVFMPLALILRTTGHDPLRRKRDSKLTSYRVVRDRVPDAVQMERPF